MGSSIFYQAAEFLRENKTARRALGIMVCLALLVVLGTVGVLTSTGQALTKKVKVLDCVFEVHQHTQDCYDENGVLACARADYAVHVHNDDCFDEAGNLVCPLPEVYPHTHTDECWQDVTELICGQTEDLGHTHSDACYSYEQGAFICDKEEHTHDETCYSVETVLSCEIPEHAHSDACYDPETGELICGLEEHAHGDACYTQNQIVVCGKEEHIHDETCYEQIATLTCTETEREPGHIHTDECYQTERVLVCDKLENHEHTEDCFAHDENGNRVGFPICGQIELLEHVHGEACFKTVEVQVSDDSGAICGLVEHTHDESCFDPETGAAICGYPEHIHDASCFPAEEAPAEPESEPEPEPVYVCGLEEHAHDETCYDENGQLICGLEEHTHSDSCLAAPAPAETPAPEPVLICGLEEHVHDESCVGDGNELICGKTAHTHDESCLGYPEPAEETPVFYCGKEEHTHDETCFDENGEAICGLEEHTHSDECLVPAPVYYCGKEEHTHDETCFDENGELICTLEEHTHGKLCATQDPVFYCELEEHTHTEACFNAAGELICELPEHTHSDECLTPVFTQTAEVEGVRVTAKYGPAANIPQGAELKVELISSEGDTAEYYEKLLEEADKIYSEQIAEEENQFFSPLALLNVGFFLKDGSEVQPAAPVTVTVQFLDETGAAVGDPVTVIHFAETGTEVLDGSALDEEQTSVFTTNSFSAMFIGTGGTAQIANTDTASGGGGKKEFAHTKTIDYLGDNQNNGTDNKDTDADNGAVTDDLYRLYLDMTGECEPIDLVIVIDRSDSMKEKMSSGKTRWKTVYEILEGTKDDGSDGLLYDFLKVNEGKTTNEEKNFVSIVWFAGEFYDRSESIYGSDTNAIPPNNDNEGGTVLDWTSSYTHRGTTNYEISPYKGVSWGVACTNYVAGLYQADQKLNSIPKGTENHKKVVVFMSDGIPVYYYRAEDMNWTKPGSMRRYGGGAEDYTYTDTGSSSSLIKNYIGHSPAKSFYESPYFNETLKIFNGASNSFVTRNPNISFYTVAIDLEKEKINSWDRTTLLKDMAASYTGGSMYSATDTAGLKKFLQQIMFPAGVSITDSLSAYVDIYKTDPDILVTATAKKGGKVTTLWKGPASGFNVDANGVVQNGTTSQLNKVDVIKNVTYDASTKTIAVHFVDDYCLSNEYTYTLSFNVKLTAKAYNDYATNANKNQTAGSDNAKGYTTQGDGGTDYGGNSTSSGKGGFHSNDKATVDYNINGNTDSLDYDHPVVQAWGTSFAFTKYEYERALVGGHPTEGTDLKPFAGVPFRLERVAASGKTYSSVTPQTGTYKNQTTDEKTYYLTGEDGTIKYGYLLRGTYTLYELVPEGYEGEGTERKVLTFTVEKGRITSMKAEDGVELSLTEGKSVDLKTTNSTTNHVYQVKADEVRIYNTPAVKTLSAYKVDAENNGKLKGAVFELHSVTRDASGKYTLGDRIDTYISNELGLLFKDQDFRYGLYALVETNAPVNYKRLEESVIFEVSKEGVAVLQNGEHVTVDKPAGEETAITISIQDDRIVARAQLRKENGNISGEAVKGARFALYGAEPGGLLNPDEYKPNDADLLWEGVSTESGDVIGTGVSEGESFLLLKAGNTYFLVETETPAGYAGLPAPVQITVTNDGKITTSLYQMQGGSGYFRYDEPTKGDDGVLTYEIVISNYNGYELPESGGEGAAPLYAVGIGLLALSAALLARSQRRRRGERA